MLLIHLLDELHALLPYDQRLCAWCLAPWIALLQQRREARDVRKDALCRGRRAALTVALWWLLLLNPCGIDDDILPRVAFELRLCGLRRVLRDIEAIEQRVALQEPKVLCLQELSDHQDDVDFSVRGSQLVQLLQTRREAVVVGIQEDQDELLLQRFVIYVA